MAPSYIGVIGSGDNVSPEVLGMAQRVGEAIARGSAVLVCGGRGGVMQAACQGAKQGGGTTVGILPSLSREGANPYVDVAISTGLGFALRNFITIRSSDAVIMIQGEVGTLSEAILCYQHGIPLIALETTGGWASRLQEAALDSGAYFDGRRLMQIQYARTPEEAVQMAFQRIGTVPTPPKI